jgi:hypothetical protein
MDSPTAAAHRQRRWDSQINEEVRTMAKNTKSAKKRANVQNLPTAAKELTKKEAKKVKGGVAKMAAMNMQFLASKMEVPRESQSF